MLINKTQKDDKKLKEDPVQNQNERNSISKEKRSCKALALFLAGALALETLFSGCATTKTQEKQERCRDADECALTAIECNVDEIEKKLDKLETRINETRKRIEKLDENIMSAFERWHHDNLCKRYDDYIKEIPPTDTKRIKDLRNYMKKNIGCK